MLIEVIERIEKIFNDTKTRSYFQRDIQWLNRRKEIWNRNIWRVGLIGITSTGKSALINALIGRQLLPERVRPSSNTMVNCQYGEKEIVTIIYNNNSEKKLRGDNIDELKKLADENENPNNEKEVKEINIESPHFKAPRNIALVDTPGLDAYGLERHEEITLKMILPLLDIVLFITHTKASSDKVNIDFLDNIIDEDKPIIIVQNKIDSVEPKLADGGKIEKTKEQVIEDHLKRLSKIKQNTRSNSLKSSHIVQISAKWGCSKENWGKSNIESLLDYFKLSIKQLENEILNGRKNQIINHLDEIIHQLKNIILEKEEGYKEILNSKYNNAKIEKDLNSYNNNLEQNFNLLKNDINKIDIDIKSLIIFIRDESDEKIKLKIEGIYTEFKDKNIKLSEIITDTQNKYKEIAQQLNLKSDDFYNKIDIDRNFDSDIPVPTKIETKTTLVENKRLLGGIQRSIGKIIGTNWGWDTIIKKEQKIDKEKVIDLLNYDFYNNVKWLETTRLNYFNQHKNIMKTFYDELNRRNKDVENKKNQNIDPDTLKNILWELKSIKKDLEIIDTPKVRKNYSSHPFESEYYSELKVPKIFDLIRLLSNSIYRNYFYSMKDYFLNKINKENRSLPDIDTIIIWGWDQESIILFFNRFWKLSSNIDIKFQNGISKTFDKRHHITIVNESMLDKNNVEIKELKSNNVLIFLLVDISSSGSFYNKVDQSPIRKVIEKKPVICVFESFQEFINADNVGEAYIEFVEIQKFFKMNTKGILVNHSLPIWSIFFQKLFIDAINLKTIKEEQKWISDLKSIPNITIRNSELEMIGRTIREHTKRKGSNHG